MPMWRRAPSPVPRGRSPAEFFPAADSLCFASQPRIHRRCRHPEQSRSSGGARDLPRNTISPSSACDWTTWKSGASSAASKPKNPWASAPVCPHPAQPFRHLSPLRSTGTLNCKARLIRREAMDSGIITSAAFFLFLAGALTYTIILYNGLVRLRNENDRAWATFTCCSSSVTTKSPTWSKR